MKKIGENSEIVEEVTYFGRRLNLYLIVTSLPNAEIKSVDVCMRGKDQFTFGDQH